MKSSTQMQRQSLGCGYEPRTDRVRLSVWQPPTGQRGYQGSPFETCAGYTANLSEVIEAAIARAHWKHGAIVPACDGEQPTGDFMDSILILDSEYSAVEGWLMTPAKDGGGGN